MRRALFEGDTAIIELRSKMADTQGGELPELRKTTASVRPVLRAVVRYVAVVLLAAAVSGAAGYVAGHIVRERARAARLAAAFADVQPREAADHRITDIKAPLMLAMHVTAPERTLEPAWGVLPVQDTSWDPAEITLRLRLGADLMAAGDVAAARTMFERAAETGDAAGAFALASTYDPAVLAAMPLRGGIKPDPAQARRWYETARDRGSSAAAERIARLPAP